MSLTSARGRLPGVRATNALIDPRSGNVAASRGNVTSGISDVLWEIRRWSAKTPRVYRSHRDRSYPHPRLVNLQACLV